MKTRIKIYITLSLLPLILAGCVSGSIKRETTWEPHGPVQLTNTPACALDTYKSVSQPLMKTSTEIKFQDSRSFWGGVSAVGSDISGFLGSDSGVAMLKGVIGTGSGAGLIIAGLTYFGRRKQNQMLADHKDELNSTWDEAHKNGLMSGLAANTKITA